MDECGEPTLSPWPNVAFLLGIDGMRMEFAVRDLSHISHSCYRERKAKLDHRSLERQQSVQERIANLRRTLVEQEMFLRQYTLFADWSQVSGGYRHRMLARFLLRQSALAFQRELGRQHGQLQQTLDALVGDLAGNEADIRLDEEMALLLHWLGEQLGQAEATTDGQVVYLGTGDCVGQVGVE